MNIEEGEILKYQNWPIAVTLGGFPRIHRSLLNVSCHHCGVLLLRNETISDYDEVWTNCFFLLLSNIVTHMSENCVKEIHWKCVLYISIKLNGIITEEHSSIVQHPKRDKIPIENCVKKELSSCALFNRHPHSPFPPRRK